MLFSYNSFISSHLFRRLYQELVPHFIDPRYRDRLRERLERHEMMLRRRNLDMPEFYVGMFAYVFFVKHPIML